MIEQLIDFQSPTDQLALALLAGRRLRKQIIMGPGVRNPHKGIKAYPVPRPPTAAQKSALALHQARRAIRYLRSKTRDHTPPSHIREKIAATRAMRHLKRIPHA